jgi:IS605 OrfB family transposase
MDFGGFVTIQTRLRLLPEMEALFERFAERFGRDLGRLNRLLDRGTSQKQAKRQFIREGLTARQFNSIAYVLKGIRKSRAASRAREIRQKERRARILEERLKLPPEKGGYRTDVAHQKKRLLYRLRAFLKKAKSASPPIIFGGRKLWKAHDHLSASGYASHQEWKAAWREARSREFFLVGSRGESFGNQSCQLNVATHTLQVRLPDFLGGAVMLEEVTFRYGRDVLEEALLQGIAISYRFVRKKKGAWYLLASTRPPKTPVRTSLSRGALGVDLGPDRISFVDTDAQGNLVFRKTFRLLLEGKSKTQARALIEKVAQEISIWGLCTGKPVVLEELDFEEKKTLLREQGPGYARMLSAFAYRTMIQAIRSRCARSGVGVIQVNPAFTSVIGVVKYSSMYGLSGDEAAALAVARRAMNLGESVPTRTAFRRPEDRRKHVWSLWNRFGKALSPGWRHAFISARRRSGGETREYPAFPARASPGGNRRRVRGQTLDPRVGRPARISGSAVGPGCVK